MSSLAEKIVYLHHALEQTEIPHAFGGALALAWCTEQARATIDIDINIFLSVEQSKQAFNALPTEIKKNKADLKGILKEGQIRLWWDKTPIDIFMNTTNLHQEMAQRCRWETFLGESIPFLSCHDIAVLKTFFNRTKDWADLEAMQAAGTLDPSRVSATIIEYLGTDDERVDKLKKL